MQVRGLVVIIIIVDTIRSVSPKQLAMGLMVRSSRLGSRNFPFPRRKFQGGINTALRLPQKSDVTPE